MFFRNFLSALKCLPRPWRVFFVSVVGYAALLTGGLMLVLPGPGTIVVLLGIAVLALEFEWARQASKNGQQWLERAIEHLKKMRFWRKRK